MANNIDLISDLETQLLNEKEFNAASQRINTEYLVNVLKKFFLVTELTERSKLVAVICNLLHFRSDETKIIVDKWTVKPMNMNSASSLVGWFMTPQQTSSQTSMITSINRNNNEKIKSESIDR